MKKLFVATLTLILFSCGSNDKKPTEDKSKNEVGIQNSNGNLPDTTNAINLSTHKKDTTMSVKDSSK